MTTRRGVISGFAAIAFARPYGSAAPATPGMDEWAHPEWFAVADDMGRDNRQSIALTPVDDFAAGHVPGAAQIDWSELTLVDSSSSGVDGWVADVCQTLGARGIRPDQAIDLYDGGTFYAARLFWILTVLGHAEIRILDGGLATWLAAGGVAVRGQRPIAAGAPPYAAQVDLTSLASIDDVETAVADGTAVLVDARTAAEFADGHIPGAVNVPFLENAEPASSGRWKSPDALRAMYEAVGVTPDASIIPYCSSGVRSANTWFTLRALGYEDVRLFSGSFIEWSSDPARPVES